MINVLTYNDIKQALWKADFRELFSEYKKEIDTFISKPDCACNNSLFNKLIKHSDKLKTYFPDKELPEQLSNWKVINCHIDELQKELKKLPRGHKQVAITRYQDQVTVVINLF